MNSYWCPFDALLEDRRIRRCRCGFFLFCNIFIGLYLERLSADSRSKLPRYRILNRYTYAALVTFHFLGDGVKGVVRDDLRHELLLASWMAWLLLLSCSIIV